VNRSELLDLLYADLSNTVGCTDVGAIGFAAAKAASLLQGKLVSAELELSNLLYKNALRVGIPGTHTAGVEKAILLGYLLKNPERELAVFEAAGEPELDALAQLEQSIPITISHIDSPYPLHINLSLVSASSRVRVLLAREYDHIHEVEVDGEFIVSGESAAQLPVEGADRRLDTCIDELYLFVTSEDEALEALLDMAEINFRTAQLGLGEGIDIRPDPQANLERAASLVRQHILSGSGLRMSGAAVPVTGVAGSGNLGMTTLSAVLVMTRLYAVDDTTTRRSLALAVLVSTYIKRKMTLLTTICGSSLAGGAAVSAAAVFLRGGDLDQLKNAINMLLAINAGTLCDGAKQSCAFKVGFSAENGVIAAKMALAGERLEGENGLNKPDVEQSIQNIADINNLALESASQKILEII
jgi:L-cysteine desulfidase